MNRRDQIAGIIGSPDYQNGGAFALELVREAVQKAYGDEFSAERLARFMLGLFVYVRGATDAAARLGFGEREILDDVEQTLRRIN